MDRGIIILGCIKFYQFWLILSSFVFIAYEFDILDVTVLVFLLDNSVHLRSTVGIRGDCYDADIGLLFEGFRDIVVFFFITELDQVFTLLEDCKVGLNHTEEAIVG